MAEKLLTSALSSGGAFRFGKESDGEISRWIAATEVARNAIGSAHGVKVGDRCWVEATNIFYVCTAVTGELTSTWIAVTGVACPPVLSNMVVNDPLGAATIAPTTSLTLSPVSASQVFDLPVDHLDLSFTVTFEIVLLPAGSVPPTLNSASRIAGGAGVSDTLRVDIDGTNGAGPAMTGAGVMVVENTATGCTALFGWDEIPA